MARRRSSSCFGRARRAKWNVKLGREKQKLVCRRLPAGRGLIYGDGRKRDGSRGCARVDGANPSDSRVGSSWCFVCGVSAQRSRVRKYADVVGVLGAARGVMGAGDRQ